MSTDCSDCVNANEGSLNSLSTCSRVCHANDTNYHTEMAKRCVNNNNIGQFKNLNTTCNNWYQDIITDVKKSKNIPDATIKAVNQVFIDYCTTGDNYKTDECSCISSYNGDKLNQYGDVVDSIVSFQPNYTKDNINCWFKMCKCNSPDCFIDDEGNLIFKPIDGLRDIQPPNSDENKCGSVMNCLNIIIGTDGEPMPQKEAKELTDQLACGDNIKNVKYVKFMCNDCTHTQETNDPNQGYYTQEECYNNCKAPPSPPSPPSPPPDKPPSPSIPVLNIVLSSVIIIFIIGIIFIVISFSILGGNKKTLYKTSKYINI